MKATTRPLLAFLTAGLVLILAGCAIVQNVSPVPAQHRIDKIFIVENQKVLMTGFLPELRQQIEDLGFPTVVVPAGAPLPAGAYVLDYTANWNWDVAEYLVYFRAVLRRDGALVGSVTYDSRSGGARLDKFGRTADKIRPLVARLLAAARPAQE